MSIDGKSKENPTIEIIDGNLNSKLSENQSRPLMPKGLN